MRQERTICAGAAPHARAPDPSALAKGVQKYGKGNVGAGGGVVESTLTSDGEPRRPIHGPICCAAGGGRRARRGHVGPTWGRGGQGGAEVSVGAWTCTKNRPRRPRPWGPSPERLPNLLPKARARASHEPPGGGTAGPAPFACVNGGPNAGAQGTGCADVQMGTAHLPKSTALHEDPVPRGSRASGGGRPGPSGGAVPHRPLCCPAACAVQNRGQAKRRGHSRPPCPFGAGQAIRPSNRDPGLFWGPTGQSGSWRAAPPPSRPHRLKDSTPNAKRHLDLSATNLWPGIQTSPRGRHTKRTSKTCHRRP